METGFSGKVWAMLYWVALVMAGALAGEPPAAEGTTGALSQALVGDAAQSEADRDLVDQYLAFKGDAADADDDGTIGQMSPWVDQSGAQEAPDSPDVPGDAPD